MSFVHLHTFSSYSLLSSTIMPDVLVKEAKKLGYEAIALTDHNVMYGVIPFYKACIQHSLKPIIGLTADVISPDDEKQSFPFIFIAKNNEGLKNLLKISSSIQVKSPNGIPIKWLKHYTKGLFVITPGREGEIEQLLLNGENEKAVQRVKYYQSIFEKNSFYFSLQNFQGKDDQLLIKKLIDLAHELQIPYVATHKICFLQEDDYEAWKCLQAIKENINIEQLDAEKNERQYYLKSPEEMKELFSEYKEAVENTLAIAKETEIEIPLNQGLNLPKYPVKGKSADEYLKELCEKGLQEKVNPILPEYKERLQYELKIITEMKYSDYFLIVWDYIHYARKQGILVGPGRGSAASSLVAYTLGITDVDPLKFELLFERFLNPERVSMPDIDVDFPDHRRDEVIEYVANKYGYQHVAQIITFGTFAAKAAMRDVARVYGLTGKELEMISKAIPSKIGLTLDEAVNLSPALQQLLQEPKYRKIFTISRKIEGLPRHTSTHAAGVVISEKPLIELIPLQSGHGEILLTQYPMGILEELGLLKMDFLGLRNLSMIESIVSMIEKNENQVINIKNIPFQDEKTFQLLQSGDTTGIFQLESEGMRKVLKELKPTEFEDIVAVNALYRPGPMQFISNYIRRKHRLEPVRYVHDDLAQILKSTYGVIIYQEQIMQIAAKMAGFTLGEADLLRRAVSKKKREILDQERIHFVEGAVQKGYSKEIANQVYDMIVRFADYGFPRSHAVAYSMISYQLAYLKAHYPLYFMATLLTSVIGNEEKTKEYIHELRKMGYAVLGPSINRSGYHFTVENKMIRMSLSNVKGIGIQALKEILRARKEKPFKDLFDFCLRVSLKIINRKMIESLINSGCFDEFGYDRATLLATLDVAIEHAQLFSADDQQIDIFSSLDIQFKPKYVEVEPMPMQIKLQYEKELLGVFVSKHPASTFRQWFQSHGALFLNEITMNHRYVKVGIYVLDEKKIRTKNGELMSFLKISDETMEMDAVVFPDIYKKYGVYLQKDSFALLTGTVEKRNGTPQLIVKEAVPVG